MQLSTDLVGIKKPAGSAWKSCGLLPSLRTRQKNGGSGRWSGKFSDATIRAHYAGSAPGSGLQRAATCHGRRDRLAWNFASCGRKAAGHFSSVSGLGEEAVSFRVPHMVILLPRFTSFVSLSLSSRSISITFFLSINRFSLEVSAPASSFTCTWETRTVADGTGAWLVVRRLSLWDNLAMTDRMGSLLSSFHFSCGLCGHPMHTRGRGCSCLRAGPAIDRSNCVHAALSCRDGRWQRPLFSVDAFPFRMDD